MELAELERMRIDSQEGPRLRRSVLAAESIYEEPFLVTPDEVVTAIDLAERRCSRAPGPATFRAGRDFEAALHRGRHVEGVTERRHSPTSSSTFCRSSWGPSSTAWIRSSPEPPVVIQAAGWDRWYSPERKVGRTFYWTALADHLENQSGWAPASILSLDQEQRCRRARC